MQLTNKLFSLLGFAQPIELKRFNGKNHCPERLLCLSTSPNVSAIVQHTLQLMPTHVSLINDALTEQSLDAMIIDASHYVSSKSYQTLYQLVHRHLKFLTSNARIVILGKKIDAANSHQQNTFSRSLIGFTKSLAKEVGRKGTTANMVFTQHDASFADNSDKLTGPLSFFLSAKSTFVSGQVLTLGDNKETQQAVEPSMEAIAEKKSAQKPPKIAVVTGAAQGIGAAIASQLFTEGYYVIGVDIEPMKALLTATMAKLNGDALVLDVSDENAGKQLAQHVSAYNGIDLLVHNAGITRDKTIAKMPEHWWQQTISINLLAVMQINQQLLDNNSINKAGRIVCLSSMNGIAGQGGQTNYACSKAGIIGYVESMRADLLKQHITINCVAPGFIETEMTQKMPFFTREIGRRINALGQAGLPDDVAQVIAFFGEQSSYAVSGQTIRVCGLNMIGA
jgi:3-oxoacyl-[acyl-carrier protein] reductase